MSRVSDAIRERMTAHNWTVADLAAIFETSTSAIYNLLAGKTDLSPHRAVQLSAALGENARWWMDLYIADAVEEIRSDPLMQMRTNAIARRLVAFENHHMQCFMGEGI